MSEEDFDELVNEATHAVNNLLPHEILDGLTADEHSKFLTRVNDALTPILRDVIIIEEPDDAP